MTMPRTKRTAVAQEIRALLSQIEDISQKDWEDLEFHHPTEGEYIVARNALKTIIHHLNTLKGGSN